MKDQACVEFLQWALPQLHMRWPGFRRVYGQVCKRLKRRLHELNLAQLEQYRDYLATHSEEWPVLDELCRVTVARFYRDRMMFAFLAKEVLPQLATRAINRQANTLDIWSIGCASGEEPYTINLIWQLTCQQRFPQLHLNLLATDTSAELLSRMAQGCYAYATIKNLPLEWRKQVFEQQGDQYCLQTEYRGAIQTRQQDVRETIPAHSFDLILCRNLVCTYYDEALQIATMTRITQRLRNGGALVLGIHEQLPVGIDGFEAWSDRLRIYRKTAPH